MAREYKSKKSTIQILMWTSKEILSIAPFTAILEIIAMLVMAIIPGVITYYSSIFFKEANNYIDGYNNIETLINTLIFLIILFILKELADSVFNGSMAKLDINIGYHFNILFARKCYRLPLLNYENTDVLDDIKRTKRTIEDGKITDLFLSFNNVLIEVFQIVGIMSILTAFNIWFMPISLLSILPYFIVRLIRGKEFYYLKWFQAKRERKMQYLYQLFCNKQSIREIRFMGSNQYIEEKWVQVRKELNEEIWKYKKKDLLSLFFCDLLKILGYLASIALSVLLVIQGRINVGVLAACIVAFANVQSTMQWLLVNLGRIPEHANFVREYYNFINVEEEETNGNIFSFKDFNISMNSVYFRYPNAVKDSICDVSLNIKSGETIAIVGENGCGKTTLTKLLIGIYNCNSGDIMYSNQNIKDIDKNSLYQKISIIAQDFTKYNFTIRENICIGNVDDIGNDEKFKDLLDEVGLSELINKDIGLDTKMGREFGGIEISIGQWQKLAIARGLCKPNEVIVIDEPTAALDPVIETEILRKFISIVKDKTAFIVSHRVGMCKYVDRIIVMKDGRVVECGTHNQLLEQQGEYEKLYLAQSKWYE